MPSDRFHDPGHPNLRKQNDSSGPNRTNPLLRNPDISRVTNTLFMAGLALHGIAHILIERSYGASE
jgi:hypothetical protein